MGSVLSFRPRIAAVRRQPVATGAIAAVIIFPGVRYERERPTMPVSTASAIRVDNRQEQPSPRR
jgi:hypothetical protein